MLNDISSSPRRVGLEFERDKFTQQAHSVVRHLAFGNGSCAQLQMIAVIPCRRKSVIAQ
jgi:hypothetical protein